jgi:hypothetical protein
MSRRVRRGALVAISSKLRMLLLELCRKVFAIYHFVHHGYVASQYDASLQVLRLVQLCYEDERHLLGFNKEEATTSAG